MQYSSELRVSRNETEQFVYQVKVKNKEVRYV